jgi:RNA polymerase sigma factor (TIGR02999 family)
VNATRPATQLLHRIREGEEQASAELLPLVYAELREMAGHLLQRERKDHTLQPTALVHEAYLRLVEGGAGDWRSKTHFFAIAGGAIRRILVDSARVHQAQKRGGASQRITLNEPQAENSQPPLDLIDLDAALQRLADRSERQARVIELRFFAGLSIEETAYALDISTKTVKQDWQVARAWLLRELRATSS